MRWAHSSVGSTTSTATTPMIGRTLGQYALATTFGNVTSRWRDGLDEATTHRRSSEPGTARPTRWPGRRQCRRRRRRGDRRRRRPAARPHRPVPFVAHPANADRPHRRRLGPGRGRGEHRRDPDRGAHGERRGRAARGRRGSGRLVVDGAQAQPDRRDQRPCRRDAGPRPGVDAADGRGRSRVRTGEPARGTPSGRRSTRCSARPAPRSAGSRRACSGSPSTPSGWSPTWRGPEPSARRDRPPRRRHRQPRRPTDRLARVDRQLDRDVGPSDPRVREPTTGAS